MPPLDPLQDYHMPYGGRLAVSQQRLIRLVYFVTLYCLTPNGPKKEKEKKKKFIPLVWTRNYHTTLPPKIRVTIKLYEIFS